MFILQVPKQDTHSELSPFFRRVRYPEHHAHRGLPVVAQPNDDDDTLTFILDPVPRLNIVWKQVLLSSNARPDIPLSKVVFCRGALDDMMNDDATQVNNWILTGYVSHPACEIVDVVDGDPVANEICHTLTERFCRSAHDSCISDTASRVAAITYFQAAFGIKKSTNLNFVHDNPNAMSAWSTMLTTDEDSVDACLHVESIDKLVYVCSLIGIFAMDPTRTLGHSDRLDSILLLLLRRHGAWLEIDSLANRIRVEFCPCIDTTDIINHIQSHSIPMTAKYKKMVAHRTVAQLNFRTARMLKHVIKHQLALFSSASASAREIAQKVGCLFRTIGKHLYPTDHQLETVGQLFRTSHALCVLDAKDGYGKTSVMAIASVVARHYKMAGLSHKGSPLVVLLGASSTSAHALESRVASFWVTDRHRMYAHTCGWFIARAKDPRNTTSPLYCKESAKLFVIDDAHLLDDATFLQLIETIEKTSACFQIVLAGNSDAWPIHCRSKHSILASLVHCNICRITVHKDVGLPSHPYEDMVLIQTVKDCVAADEMYNLIAQKNVCCPDAKAQGYGCCTKGSHFATRQGVFWYPECAARTKTAHRLILGWTVALDGFVPRPRFV